MEKEIVHFIFLGLYINAFKLLLILLTKKLITLVIIFNKVIIMPLAIYALTVGAFGIGVTEFVIMGLLIEVSTDLGISIPAAGLLISGYALGVVIGAPFLTSLMNNWPRKRVLLVLMVIFICGNAACALAPNYELLMAARILTAFTHGTFFGIGSVVATNLVLAEKRSSAIAAMFTGLTVANIAGVPFGTWLGQYLGWRATFWAITIIGIICLAIIAMFIPSESKPSDSSNWRNDLKSMARKPVIFGLLSTTLGYAGFFAVFTFISPILTQISGFELSEISPILLLFGVGLVIGNIAGGLLADKKILPTLIWTIALLGSTLIIMTWAMNYKATALIFTVLLGITAFSTVSPLQTWILKNAEGAGQSLASSLNIAAFNLGNAIGAWIAGIIIEYGPGLSYIPVFASLLTFSAIGVIYISINSAHKDN
ncbi:MFS transporter [Xenorhabdus sp. SF857]|uniref:MFS transporter n=1 Tax=Xenorhabdus bakwenae TaxID=3026967 RepID=UPI00255813AF|nr:MFS transporter [Xenorhabdus sp. SF857]WFQ78998.1 MFS transporter [Xenorhabdus sp. SF857]